MIFSNENIWSTMIPCPITDWIRSWKQNSEPHRNSERNKEWGRERQWELYIDFIKQNNNEESYTEYSYAYVKSLSHDHGTYGAAIALSFHCMYHCDEGTNQMCVFRTEKCLYCCMNESLSYQQMQTDICMYIYCIISYLWWMSQTCVTFRYFTECRCVYRSLIRW